MNDTLRWIPSINSSRNERQRGLCIHGLTVIDSVGAAVAVPVFAAWADLLSAGPADLYLTGSYSWSTEDDGVSPTPGDYERVEVRRDDVVKVLRQLADDCRQIDAAGDRLYLLHQGI